jgi:hypothetical protein
MAEVDTSQPEPEGLSKEDTEGQPEAAPSADVDKTETNNGGENAAEGLAQETDKEGTSDTNVEGSSATNTEDAHKADVSQEGEATDAVPQTTGGAVEAENGETLQRPGEDKDNGEEKADTGETERVGEEVNVKAETAVVGENDDEEERDHHLPATPTFDSDNEIPLNNAEGAGQRGDADGADGGGAQPADGEQAGVEAAAKEQAEDGEVKPQPPVTRSPTRTTELTTAAADPLRLNNTPLSKQSENNILECSCVGKRKESGAVEEAGNRWVRWSV